MKIIDCKKVNEKLYGGEQDREFWFIRVDYDDLGMTLRDILTELSNLSWLEKFDKNFLKKSFEKNALNTCIKLKEKFFSGETPLINNAAEYMVSCLAKRAIVEKLNHLDVPLAELLGRKVIGNPGFDFFTENAEMSMVYCGEAKYVANANPYNDSLGQINDFIKDEKYISDLFILNSLVSDNSLTHLSEHIFGVAAAFSATNIKTEILIKNIVKNSEYKKCTKAQDLILVAVNIYEK